MSDKVYRTKDLSESAALLTLGQKIIEVERIGNICWFVFDNFVECQKIVVGFWYGSCMVNAKSYYDSILRLKNRIFSS